MVAEPSVAHDLTGKPKNRLFRIMRRISGRTLVRVVLGVKGWDSKGKASLSDHSPLGLMLLAPRDQRAGFVGNPAWPMG